MSKKIPKGFIAVPRGVEVITKDKEKAVRREFEDSTVYVWKTMSPIANRMNHTFKVAIREKYYSTVGQIFSETPFWRGKLFTNGVIRHEFGHYCLYPLDVFTSLKDLFECRDLLMKELGIDKRDKEWGKKFPYALAELQLYQNMLGDYLIHIHMASRYEEEWRALWQFLLFGGYQEKRDSTFKVYVAVYPRLLPDKSSPIQLQDAQAEKDADDIAVIVQKVIRGEVGKPWAIKEIAKILHKYYEEDKKHGEQNGEEGETACPKCGSKDFEITDVLERDNNGNPKKVRIKCKNCGYEVDVEVNPYSSNPLRPSSKAHGIKAKWSKEDVDKIFENSKGASREDLGEIGIDLSKEDYLEAFQRSRIRKFIRENVIVSKESKRKEGELFRVSTDVFRMGDSLLDINIPQSELASLGIDDLRMIPELTLKKNVYVTVQGQDYEQLKGVRLIAFLDVSGCLVGDTLIQMEDGSLKRIKDVKEGDRVIVNGRSAKFGRKVLKVWKYPDKEVLKITLKDGRTLELTPNHKVFVYSKKRILEVPASELKIGDYMVILRKIPNKSSPQKLPKFEKVHKDLKIPEETSPEFCQIIGYLLGDGHKSEQLKNSSGYLALTDENRENLEFYQDLIKKVFGINPLIRERGRLRLYINSRPLMKYITRNFPTLLTKSPSREIPELFTRVSNKELGSLLRGLFDAEGTIGNHSVELISTSENLIKQVQLLLARFGILAEVYQYIQKERRLKGKTIKPTKAFRLVIYGSSIKLFKEFIGFSSKEKARKLAQLNPSSWRKRSLKFLSSSKNLALMPVVKIEKGESTDVYDLTIEGFHRYFGNGILVHNSMMGLPERKALAYLKETWEICKKLDFEFYLCLFSTRAKRIPKEDLKKFFEDSSYRQSVSALGGGTQLSEGLKLFEMREYKDANIVIFSDCDIADEEETRNLMIEISKMTNSFKIIIIRESMRINDEEIDRIQREWFSNTKIRVLGVSTSDEEFAYERT